MCGAPSVIYRVVSLAMSVVWDLVELCAFPQRASCTTAHMSWSLFIDAIIVFIGASLGGLTRE